MRPASLILMLALGATSFAGAPPAPRLVATDGEVVVRGLGAMLEAPEVAPHLDSGLTNSFIIDLRLHRGRRQEHGAARVDLRWEPWDEVYLLSAKDQSGTVTRVILSSRDELAHWWAEASFSVLTGSQLPPGTPAQLTVGFIPFSQAESEAARRWLTHDAGSADHGDTTHNEPGGQRDQSAVVDLVVATSIVRESIFQMEWQLVLEPGGDH